MGARPIAERLELVRAQLAEMMLDNHLREGSEEQDREMTLVDIAGEACAVRAAAAGGGPIDWAAFDEAVSWLAHPTKAVRERAECERLRKKFGGG